MTLSISLFAAALLAAAPAQVKPPHIVCNDAVDATVVHPSGPQTFFNGGWGPASDGFATDMVLLPVAGEERAIVLVNQPALNEQVLWAIAIAPDGSSEYLHRIALGEGGFTGPVDDNDGFGSSLELLDDLDGDGFRDLAVGAYLLDGLNIGDGGVWILFLDGEGMVARQQLISTTAGDFTGVLKPLDRFGGAVAWLGDLDGDGTGELAVAASGDDDGASNAGAVWILFMRPDGTVRTHTKISALAGNFTGVTTSFDGFGANLTTLPDLDGDGRRELAVAAYDDDDGGDTDSNFGAVWILFLEADGTVRDHQRISPTTTPLSGPWHEYARFGFSMSWVPDSAYQHGGRLAVATWGRIAELFHHTWMLELDADGQVATFEPMPVVGPGLGILPLGDLDGNGLDDLLLSILGTTTCPQFKGGCATKANYLKVQWGRDGSAHLPELEDIPDAGSLQSLARISDLDGNGFADVILGEPLADDGGERTGAVWVRFMDAHGEALETRKISLLSGGFTGPLAADDELGSTVAALGDLDGDGVDDIVATALGDDGVLGSDRGAVWLMLMRPDGTVHGNARIGHGTPGFADVLATDDGFGQGVTSADLDGDGRPELFVGAPYRDDGGTNTGIVYVFFLEADGSIQSWSPIGSGVLGLPAAFSDSAWFGWALAALGDLDGDGVVEVAVSEHGSDDGGFNRGAVWILSIDGTGQVVRQLKLSQTSGHFPAQLPDGGRFGRALSAPGDLDGDGVPDLLVASRYASSVWLVLLNASGTAKDVRSVSTAGHPFYGLDTAFGDHVALLDPGPSGHRPLLVGTGSRYWRLCLGLGTWADEGLGLAGTGGLVPRLTARGFQLPGEAVDFSLDQARRDSTAALVFGLSLLNAPFAGGTLVPAPDVLHLGLPIDADGELELSFRWPKWSALPPGSQVWAQAFVADTGAPLGLSASNGVVGVSP